MVLVLIAALIFFSFPSAHGQVDDAVIILKMDDVRANSGGMYRQSWQRYADSIRSYEINSAMGAVLEDLVDAKQEFKDSLKTWHQSKYFEIWHHGWDHKRNIYKDGDYEFSGTPYDHQKEHFEDGMKYALEELGIVLRTFGAPYNQTDATFSQVIGENRDVKVWLYCKDANYSGMCLERGSSNLLESSTGIVSYNSFLTAYERNSNPYLVLQAHPGNWDNQSFEEFDKVIAFLKEKNHRFVLPYDYYIEQFGVDQMIYEEKFIDQSLDFFDNSTNNFVLETNSSCDQTILSPIEGQSLPKGQPVVFKLKSAGTERSVSIKSKDTVFLRIRSEQTLELRLDLSDGINSTNGFNGKSTNVVLGGLDNWQVISFGFTEESFSDTKVDSINISQLHLFPSPESDGFDGKIILDYISIGEASANGPGCVEYFERGYSGNIYSDHFNDSSVSVSDVGNKYILTENECGELVVDFPENEIINANDHMRVALFEPQDVSLNPTVKLKLKSENSFNLRIDLHDGNKATNGLTFGQLTKKIDGDKDNWQEMIFDFDYFSFLETGVNYDRIASIDFYLDLGGHALLSPIYLDYITLGDLDMDSDDCPITLFGTNSNNELTIYPNPNKGLFWIDTSGSEEYQFEIFDIAGSNIATAKGLFKGRTEFNYTALGKGLYLIKVIRSNDEKQIIKKIIID